VIFGERDTLSSGPSPSSNLIARLSNYSVLRSNGLLILKLSNWLQPKYSKIHRLVDLPCKPTTWTRVLFWWDCRAQSATEEELVAHYHEHKSNVVKTIPPLQLLFFNVKQGWDPLVAFLGKTKPVNTEFPWINEGAEIAKIDLFFDVLAIGWPFFLAMILFFIVVVFRKITNPCFR